MKIQSSANMFRKHLLKDQTQQRIENLQSRAGAPHRPPLSGSGRLPLAQEQESLRQIPSSWFLCGCCVSHPGARGSPISYTWGREPGKGHAACELVGSVPRCLSSGTAISFVSYEDGKEEKNSPLAFVLNSDQLLTSIVPLPHFLQFLPLQSRLLGPQLQGSYVSDMNILVSSGTDHKFCSFIWEVKPWKAEFTSGSL